jgi:queuosine precursor transporter
MKRKIKKTKSNNTYFVGQNQHLPESLFAYIVALFVSFLLISNIASTKILSLGIFTFDGGTLLFPLTYIFGDILTEVYGFKKAKKAIWIGFFCALLMTIIFAIVQSLPSAEGWNNQTAFELILGMTPRIVAASLIAYLAGSFTNSITLAKMKLITKGKYLWSRTIGSTIIGEGIDTILFCTIAFIGILPMDLLFAVIISNYFFKVGVEIILTPLTYKIINYLKRKEQIDYFDKNTEFNPFKIN